MFRHQQFTVTFILLCVVSALVIFANLLVMKNANEYADLDALLADQTISNGIYNGFSHSLADYKYRAYLSLSPEIVAIGTSRAMQIRGYFFNAPFYNLGGLVSRPEQAIAIASQLLLKKPPKVVLFMLDYWSFCGQPNEVLPSAPSSWHDGQGKTNRYFAPLVLLSKGQLTANNYFKLLMGGDEGKFRRYGISAHLSRSGFARDGSMYYAPGYDVYDLNSRFDDRLQVVPNGITQTHTCANSIRALAHLDTFVKRMEAGGSKVVLMLAPLPAVVIEKMKTTNAFGIVGADGYAYLPQLKESLIKRYGEDFFDYLDLRSIGATDCEFVDGNHGGELAYMRMIENASQRPGNALEPFVKHEVLRSAIKKYRGLNTLALDGVGDYQLPLDAATACSGVSER